MTLDRVLPKLFVRLAAVTVVAVGAGACSSVPDWANPTAWMGDDQTLASDQGAHTPDLASIPDKPAAPSTVDERQQVSEALEADRASAQYSAEELRAGTESSAPPPSDATPAETVQPTPVNTSTPSAASNPGSSSKAADASAQAEPATPVAQTEPAAPVASPAASPSTDDSAPARTATPVAETSAAAAAQPVSTSSDPSGFETSRAPALDPNVARIVPKTVLDRYEHNAGEAPAAPAQQKSDTKQTTSEIDHAGSPKTERHAAAASDDGAASTQSRMMTQAAYTSSTQSSPKAVVFFPRDTAALNAKAKEQILAAAKDFQARGNAGFVRVVGHSSSRTAEMPMAHHLELVFARSQNFANAVAHELIGDGVPADKVLIEAVGDSQPIYYESMPQGEAGNRRAEIFM